MKNIIFKLHLYLIIGLSFSACIPKELDNITPENWQPDLSIALIETEVQTKEIINLIDSKGYISFNNLDDISLNYFDSIEIIKGKEFLRFNKTIEHIDTITKAFIPELVILSEGLIQEGIINYYINDKLTEDVLVNLIFPNLSANDSILSKQILLQQQANNSGQIDISNHLLSFAEQDSTNVFIQYTATGVESKARYIFEDFTTRFTNILFQQIKLQQGKYTLGTVNSNIEIPFFANWTTGEVILHNPASKFVFTNTLGIPIEISISTFESQSNSQAVALDNDFITNGIKLIAQQTQSFNYTIDSSNSNLPDLLKISPGIINYSLDANINIDEDTTFYTVAESGSVNMDLDLAIPLSFQVINSIYLDTFNISIPDAETINEATFRIEVSNGLPMDINLQLFYTNKNFQIFDSAFVSSQNLFESGLVNTEGRTIENSVAVNYISYDFLNKYSLADIENVILKIQLNTSNSGTQKVILQGSNRVKIKLAVQTELNL